MYNNLLYTAYRGGDSSDIWYNYFDGNAWLPQDIKIEIDFAQALIASLAIFFQHLAHDAFQFRRRFVIEAGERRRGRLYR